MLNDISESHAATSTVLDQFKDEVNEDHRQRKRDKTDTSIKLKNFSERLLNIEKEIEQMNDSVSNIGDVMNIQLECSKIDHAISLQDDEDRKSISLWGM